jgi:hypothetical protein
MEGDGYMHFSQIIVMDLLNVNIAAGQPVYATSTIEGSSPPSVLVDGTTQIRGLPKIWHSASPNKDTEFVEIDLGTLQAIASIRILGRSGCPIQDTCDSRMKGLRLEINDTTDVPPQVISPQIPIVPHKIHKPERVVNISGSSNTSGGIKVNKSSNLAAVTHPDPSLPSGYQRMWDKKARKYVYQHNGQIIPHPQPPSKRVNRSNIQRPPGVKAATRKEELNILNLEGGGALPTDIEILTDPNTTPPWQKYFDTIIRKYYYVSDKEELWEHPFTPRKPVHGEINYGDPGLPNGWEKHLDSSINTYFYHFHSTGETTWDHPNPPPFPEGLTVIPNEHISQLYATYRDPKSDQIFYFNTLTTETFWILPQGILSGEAAPGILSSTPVEAFTCQRINVLAPGAMKFSASNPNYIMTSHTPVAIPYLETTETTPIGPSDAIPVVRPIGTSAASAASATSASAASDAASASVASAASDASGASAASASTLAPDLSTGPS